MPISFFMQDDNSTFAFFPFYKDGKPLSLSPKAGMTLKKAGSMRFRWNEQNQLRDKTLSSLTDKQIVSIELIHSKKTLDVRQKDDSFLVLGDGLFSRNKNLFLTVTVADCMPIFFYEPHSEVFGIVHSGWKGTGIIEEALNAAQKNYKTNMSDVSVILGPHIRDCCYIVNEERAKYFAENFGGDCVRELQDGEKPLFGGRELKWNVGEGRQFALSLEKANLAVLKKIGVLDENITVVKNCTCCTDFLGSHRRQTAEGEPFTVQAAFIC